MLNLKVKICCISSVEEAKIAIDLGATAIGLVSNMPSGPGVISENTIQEISNSIPKHVSSFLLTSKTNSSEIINQYKNLQTTTIQIVDKLPEQCYAEINHALPEVDIVQVIHVEDESSIEEAKKIAPFVDFILLDSGNPNLKTKELGGTGRVHNWEISKRIVEALDIPIYLAGGLNSSNIKAAIKTVNPYGVDLCTGVRTNGKLDIIKLKAFFATINKSLP